MPYSTSCNLFIPHLHSHRDISPVMNMVGLQKLAELEADNLKTIERWANPLGKKMCNCDCNPGFLDYVYFADESAQSASAFIGDLNYFVGDFVFNMMFSYGNELYTGFTESGGWTDELVSLAPAAPRRAYGFYQPSAPAGPFSLQWTWASPPGVEMSTITVAIHESGLDYWAQDWYDGPVASFVVNYEVHRGFLLWVWSDVGTTVVGGQLIYRSDPLDAPSIGSIEAWWIPGVAAPGSTFIDIDVTATSGNIQWATWVDVFNL